MRKYGQHFLINRGVIEKITDAAAALSAGKTVVEIGPGKGALTSALIEKGVKNLTLVEIDPQMIVPLSANMPDGVKIINEDFLKFDLNSLPAGKTFFVSNLPYIDAAEILAKVLDYKYFDGAIFMFQREQAQRITAAVSTPYYGPLSLLSQSKAEIKSLVRVSKGSFNPPPKVESEVLVFTKLKTPAVPTVFEKTVKAAFAYKRKNILNSLSESFGIEKNILTPLLEKSGISPTARAQDVSLNNFLTLSKILKGII